jgi:hypothetical protein
MFCFPQDKRVDPKTFMPVTRLISLPPMVEEVLCHFVSNVGLMVFDTLAASTWFSVWG